MSERAAGRVGVGHGTMVVRRGRIAVRWQTRTVVVCVVLAVLTVAMTVWALTLGRYPLTLPEAWGGPGRRPGRGFRANGGD